MSIDRKLVAIVFTDIVKYYKLFKGYDIIYDNELLYISGSNSINSIKANVDWE